MKRTLKEGDLVLIFWRDSAQSDKVWHELSEAKQDGREFSRSRTVGFLIEQDSDHIAIAQTWDEHPSYTEPNIAGLFNIPRGCIRAIVRIPVPKSAVKHF